MKTENKQTEWHPATKPLKKKTLKSSNRIGDGLIFPKTHRASLFNDDLSIEPNFGRIHLAGQYL
jgi:hypothetical protein